MARTTDPVLELLATVDLFEGLPAKVLHEIREAGKELTFPAGEEVAAQGRQGGRMFVILEGEVEVMVGGQVRPLLRAGDYFGEISLIDGEPRSASVRTLTPIRTWTLASFNFRPLLRAHPSVSEKVMLLLCRRLRAAETALEAARSA
ncbi:MAG: hypothetical protein NVSMB12_17680 [Acidimicrobiales bacterium]